MTRCAHAENSHARLGALQAAGTRHRHLHRACPCSGCLRKLPCKPLTSLATTYTFTTHFHNLVLIGLLYKAYPDDCQHRLEILLRLRPYPMRGHQLLCSLFVLIVVSIIITLLIMICMMADAWTCLNACTDGHRV